MVRARVHPDAYPSIPVVLPQGGRGRKGVNTDETYLRRIVGFRRIYPAIISAAVSECSRHKWALSLSHEQSTAPTWLWRQRDTALSSNNIIIAVVSSLLNRGIASSLLPSLSSLSVPSAMNRRGENCTTALSFAAIPDTSWRTWIWISFLSYRRFVQLFCLCLPFYHPCHPHLLWIRACLLYDVRVIPFYTRSAQFFCVYFTMQILVFKNKFSDERETYDKKNLFETRVFSRMTFSLILQWNVTLFKRIF